jgi:TIR domain-containing protein
MSHIFISYVREDQSLVDKLAADLTAKGALIWLDRDSINPGQIWQDAIREGIEQGNFFLACFSTSSVGKRKSVMNEELLIAVSELRKMPYGAVWFIPVLLDECVVPRIPIAPSLTLQDLQWVSLVENWNDGVERIASITLDLEKKSAEKK